jgi:dienelactone hydrolase
VRRTRRDRGIRGRECRHVDCLHVPHHVEDTIAILVSEGSKSHGHGVVSARDMSLLALGFREGGIVSRVEGGDEAVGGVSGAGKSAELAGELEDLFPELGGPFVRNAGVAVHGSQVVLLVSGDRLAGRFDQEVAQGDDLFGLDLADIENAGGTTVEPFVDGPHPPGADHLEQTCFEEDPDVEGHRAGRTVDGGGQLVDGGGPLEDEIQQRVPQRMRHRFEFRRGGQDAEVVEFVVGDRLIVRHLWIIPGMVIDREFWIIGWRCLMAEVLLFHHALGLTTGVVVFADVLREAGHTVYTPDLFDGATFGTIDEGVAHAERIGFDVVIERGVRLADELPTDLVYAGFSLGVLPAQKLAQTRPGAAGALLFHSCVPADYFGAWPEGVPVQIHGMDADPIFVGEGDIVAARSLVQAVDDAELFLYPGDQHYFADTTLSSYDAEATALLTQRVLDFLGRI